MATAITVGDLREVYYSTKDDEALGVFVDIGNMILNEQFNSCPISQERKNKIAAYVAAHFADISDETQGIPGPVRRSKLGDSDESYAVPDQTQPGYGTTKWGQLAIALDTCNILMTSTKLKAQIQVVGDNHIGNPNGTVQ